MTNPFRFSTLIFPIPLIYYTSYGQQKDDYTDEIDK